MSRPPTLQSLSGTGLPAPNPKVFCKPEPHAPLSFVSLFCTTSESSSLRFQSLGRSSAPLRGVRDGLVSIFLFPVSSFVFQFSVTPLFATLTKSSILHSPQVLCLPLLRKLPGCASSLPRLGMEQVRQLRKGVREFCSRVRTESVLLESQSNQRTNASSPSRRNPASEQRDTQQQPRHRAKSHRIPRSNAVEQISNQPRPGKRRSQSRDHANPNNPKPLPHDHLQNVPGRRPQRHANPNLMSPLRRRIRSHAVHSHHRQYQPQQPHR